MRAGEPGRPATRLAGHRESVTGCDGPSPGWSCSSWRAGSAPYSPWGDPAPLRPAIVMPVNVRRTGAELTGILNHADPRVLVYEADFAPLVEQLRQACPSVQNWVQSGEPYEEILAR